MTTPGSPWLQLVKTIDVFTEVTGRIVAWLTLAMMVLVCAVLVTRQLHLGHATAIQESVTYLHALVFLLGAAFTLKHGGHVRVDVFYHRFSHRRQALIDLFGTLLFLLPLCAVILWFSWDYVASSWAIRERSRESSGLPWIYLLKSLMLVMPITLGLQGIAEILRNLLFLTGHTRHHSENHTEEVL